MAKPPPQLPPVTSGPSNACPCPCCGKPNNFGTGSSEMLEMGGVYKCDHCGQMMQVCAVRTVKVISLRKPVGQVTRIKKQ